MSEKAAGEAGGGGKRTGLRHPLAYYAQEFDASERTVKRWRGIGEEKGDPCPLDDVERMLPWWSRCMTQSPPKGVNSAVIRARKSGETAPIAAPRPVVPVPAVVPEGELRLVASLPAAVPAVMVPLAEPVVLVPDAEPEELPIPEGRGLLVELERLEELAAKLSRRADQPGQAKPYLDTVGKMGILTGRLREEGERLKRLVPIDQAEAIIHEFHGPIAARVRAMGESMCKVLGIPFTPEIDEAWNEECDRTFAGLNGEVFVV